MQKIRDKFEQFMEGRYGTDDLSRVLLYAALILLIISLFVRFQLIYIIAVVLLVYCYYRMLSKNISKRYAENEKFLEWKGKITGKASAQKKHRADRDHRYYQCPSCHQTVRVPKGKGKINIRCPKCGTQFIRRT